MALSDLAEDLDRETLVQAAAIGVLVVGPLAGLSFLLVDTDSESSGGLGGIFFAGIVAAFGLVGFVGGRSAPRVPMTHGAIAAAATFVVVQATILLIAWVAGRDSHVSIVALVFGALVAASAGTIGAMLATRRARRR